jgi:hypothetical protein
VRNVRCIGLPPYLEFLAAVDDTSASSRKLKRLSP